MSSSRSRSGITLEDIAAWDVNFLWNIQDKVYHTPRLDRFMSRMVSKQPWNDIGLLVWVISLVGCFELGVRHFWVVTTNLGGAFLLNRIIQAKRPVEYDVRLQPTTDLHPHSYGFPSLESHMAVVVIGHIFKCTSHWLVLFLGIPLVLLVGFSRIYSRARFPHQIIASYLSGIVGLLIGIHYCEVLGGGFHNLSHHVHGVYVALAVSIFLVNLALNMENNESRVLFVPKSEFIRVIRGIMYSGEGEIGDRGGAIPSSDPNGEEDDFMDANSADFGAQQGTDNRDVRSMSAAALRTGLRRAQEEQLRESGSARERARANRKDSFFYLQKTLQSRAGIKGAGTLAAGTPRNSAPDFA